MKRTLISDLYKKTPQNGEILTVCGWIKTIRNNKFIELSDGSCFRKLQVVAEEDLVGYDTLIKQNVGAAIVVSGAIILTPQNAQPFELLAKSVQIEGTSTPDFPIQKKRASFEFLREQAYLRPRTNTFNAVFRIRSVLAQGIHDYFSKKEFIYVHTPIITGSDCEGAGEMFQVTTLDLKNPPLVTQDQKNEQQNNASNEQNNASTQPQKNGEIDYSKDFFGKLTSLTVSGQLNGEAFALAFGNIYTFGPTFRAENSNTTRHAAEFWMIEPEIAFADLDDNMELAEDMLKYVIAYALERCKDDFEFLNKFVDNGLIERLNKLLNDQFKRLSYTEAITILEKVKDRFEFPVFWGCDLQSEHEKYLTEQVFKCPVFLIDYPKEIKAFYMRINDDGKTVAAMDLLVPGIGELIGGSQREERLDILDSRIESMNLNKEDYWWYRNLRTYGGTKHAGFGIGFERLLMYATGISNIRDVTPFPRTVKNCEY